MATIKTGIIFLLALCLWCCIACKSVLKKEEGIGATVVLRDKLVKTAESQLDVREATDSNDGRDVEKYLKSVGLKKGQPWCAAFVAWLHIQENVPNPKSAWSPDWFRTNVVYHHNQPRFIVFESSPAQVFGLYYESKKRVAHVGIITRENKLHYNTIEGNTNSAGSNEGDGVYRKIRKKENIYVIADYIGYVEISKSKK